MVIRGPEDLVSAIPYLIGFHPHDSLVVIGTGGPHGTCAIRVDLPPAGSTAASEAGSEAGSVGDGMAEDTAGRFAEMLARNGFRQAYLVGYGPAERVTALIDAARPALAEAGVELGDALRVAGDRFWSYDCADLNCCPAEGTAFDISSSVVAAQATLEGQVVLADRTELVRTVAPLGGITRHAMRRATDRAERRFFDLARADRDAVAVRARMIEEGLPFVRDILARTLARSDTRSGTRSDARSGTRSDIRAGARSGARTGARSDERGDRPTDDEIAWLGVLLTHVRIRDEAWVRVDLDRLEVHIEFWRDVLRRVEEPYAAAPGCLLAYAAFAAGDGGLANVALERALGADPGYPMAQLLYGLISAGAPPSMVTRRPMTPAELAAANGEYDDVDVAPEPDIDAGPDADVARDADVEPDVDPGADAGPGPDVDPGREVDLGIERRAG
jgi:uncharacterized protein DUF4192